MPERSRVFFSYTEERVEKELIEDQKEIQKAVRAVAIQLGWELVDPLRTHRAEKVSTQVEEALDGAHLLIADLTGVSANVVFEIGYSRARRIPVLVIRHSSDPSQDTYSMLADLGDVEVLAYPETHSTAALVSFKEQLMEVCSHLDVKVTPGSRAIRSASVRVRNQLLRIEEEWVDNPDPLLLRFIGGFVDKIASDLKRGGPREFLVDPDYYEACFAGFHEAERSQALAIADLSDPTETLWVQRTQQTEMAVRERVFLVRGLDFFDDQKCKSYFKNIKDHLDREKSSDYVVRIGRADHPGHPDRHVLGRSVAKDILVFGNDLVAGYVWSDTGTHARRLLKVLADREACASARAYFKAIAAKSVVFNRMWTKHSEMKSAWMKKDGIGHWSSDWSIDHRDEHYYEDYDLHIRSWIPGYDDLLNMSATTVVDSLDELRSNHPETLPRVLEIGCGTGALTKEISKVVRNSEEASLVAEYYGIEKAPEMVRRLRSGPWPGGLGKPRFIQGRFPEAEIPDAHRKFDVICGSLVLSHLVGEDAANKLSSVLQACENLLTDAGIILFSDAMVLDPDSREHIRDQWHAWMDRNGLPSEWVKRFADGNPEMLNTVTQEILESTCGSLGLVLDKNLVPRMHAEGSPFRAILIRRKSAAERKAVV